MLVGGVSAIAYANKASYLHLCLIDTSIILTSIFWRQNPLWVKMTETQHDVIACCVMAVSDKNGYI